MIDIHDEEYWTGQFVITQEDLNRAAGRLARTGVTYDLKAIALPILKGRLEHGHDSSPAAPVEVTGGLSIRLWDPASEWQAGDVVLIVHDRFGNSRYEIFLGEIMGFDQDAVEIRIEELQTTKTYLQTLPGTENARKYGPAAETWRNLVLDLVAKKLRSDNLDEQAEGILLKYGEHILTRLAETLRRDPRFTGLEGKWYLLQRLPRIGHESLQTVHHFLLQNQPASLDEILPVVKEGPATDPSLLKMAIHSALGQSPERFENTGTAARPLWKARLPAHDQAEVTHFAFDPQTFELLCRPGQRLSQKKARRLQELNLYAHVVTFMEWQHMVRP